MSWTPHPDVGETRRVITELFNVGDERTWLIELRDTGEIIGTCGFRPVQAHSLDFGYVLGRRWWGRRLMPEVVALLLAEMESDAGVYRVSAICHVDNTRSARVLERCRPVVRGPARSPYRVSEHQHDRTAGRAAVRQGGQVATPWYE